MQKPMTTEMTTEIKDLFAVRYTARWLARKLVQAEMKEAGLRVTLIPPRIIREKAELYLQQHPELYQQAFERLAKINLSKRR